MKIAHLLLTHSFAGTERYVVELANAQADAGNEVTVILHQHSAEQRPNAFAHRFNRTVKKIFVNGPRFFSFWFARRELSKLTIDVAHAHLSAGCRALSGINCQFLRVATLHIHYKKHQHSDINALIAIAPWQLVDIPEAQQLHTLQINNWTQAPAIDTVARKKIRDGLGVKDDDFLIGALCRAEASKGLDVLINAYAMARLEKTRLVIVGDGRDWSNLRNQASDDVLMPGFAERPEEWFSAFDGYVSAARSEPFGLVFLEAFSAGLPVLSTASQGAQMFKSLIKRPLLACGDVASMAAGLQAFAKERPQRLLYDLSDYCYESQVAKIQAFYLKEITAMMIT